MGSLISGYAQIESESFQFGREFAFDARIVRIVILIRRFVRVPADEHRVRRRSVAARDWWCRRFVREEALYIEGRR